MVMSDNYGTMRVAKNDLRPHVDQFVHKEQTAFEHLLMNKHAPFGLRGNDKHYAEQVGSQSRPRCVGYRHDRAVNERFYLVDLLCGNVNIVSPLLELNAQTTETLGNNAQIFVGDVFNGYFAFGHRCHTNKATDFNHIGQYGVLCAVQFFHAFNRQKVGSYTADPGTHAVQHPAQLLQVRLAGSVVNSGSSFG